MAHNNPHYSSGYSDHSYRSRSHDRRDYDPEPYHVPDRTHRPHHPHHRERVSPSRPPRRRHRSTSRSVSPPSRYTDRDAPRSPAYDDDNRRRERFVSRDVIVEGFGLQLTDDDIMNELVQGLGLRGVEKVTVIRERKTGVSRGFGFVHFSTVEDSKEFIDRFGPMVRIGEDRCRIAFSKERDENERKRRREEEGNDWTCRVCQLVNYPRRQECFRCSAPRSEVTLTGSLTHPTPTHFTNDGERDMAAAPPSQFLIFRNLEPTVSEDLLAKGVYKLTAPASPAGAAETSVLRVLLVRDRRTHESWRYGFAEFSDVGEAQKAFAVYEKMEKFTISSKPVVVSYIHPGVFVPVYNAPAEAEQFTFTSNSVPGLRLAYWDEEGYVCEHVLQTLPPPQQQPSAAAEPEKAEKPKTKKRKAEATASATTTAAPAPHLQFWQSRHSELHGGKADNGAAVPPPVQATESFADTVKLACLLCSRQFASQDKLNEHERVSALHASNLNNPTLVDTARKKLEKRRAKNGEAYRDRARERRIVHGPEKKDAKGKGKVEEKKKVEEEEPPKESKGAALLGKMGWTAGQGLGASGEGRTQHVVAEVYTAGAGLGMAGAKVGDVEEAAKSNAGGYKEFVRKTKERARERYEGL